MKKILFIIPCIPYPLTTGGNQAFFHMVDYLRCRMSVSILLYPKGKEKEDVEKLKRIWNNVDFSSLQSKWLNLRLGIHLTING